MPTLIDEDGRPAAKDEATAALKQESAAAAPTTTTATAPAPSSAAAATTTSKVSSGSTKSSGKRSRGGTTSTTSTTATSSSSTGGGGGGESSNSVTIIHNANQQAIAAANLAAAVQMAASLQMNGLLSLLTQSSSTQGTAVVASAADPTLLGIQTNLPATVATTTTSASASSNAAASTTNNSVSATGGGSSSGGKGSSSSSKGGGGGDSNTQSSGGGVISSSSSSSSGGMNNWQIPTIDQVRQAAMKMASDIPPFVHLSKTDSAPQLKILDHDRLTLKGGMRGYRMSRATHGVSQGYYYYEILVLDPPTIHEVVNSLPPNARLGATLQKQIQTALEYDKKLKQQQKQKQQQQQQKHSNNKTSNPETPTGKAKEEEEDTTMTKGDEQQEGGGRKRKAMMETTITTEYHLQKQQRTIDPPPPQVGGHLRIGWSMRTGDLQAPVGYDKWSYGFRNLSGSKIHQSRREDNWGGEAWGPGDVIGCAILLNNNNNINNSSSSSSTTTTTTTTTGATTNTTGTSSSSSSAATNNNNNINKTKTGNQIRFFKNGSPMGHFVITKGKREGGAAFDDIQPGTYYPAISSYLGGSVRVNFGPYFVYPPRKLPHGLSAGKLQPISSLQPPPLSQQELLSRLKQRKNIFSKLGKETPEIKMNAFREAVLAESMVLQEAFDQHRRKHLRQVLEARKSRNLNIADLQQELEELEGKDKSEEEEDGDGGGTEQQQEEDGGSEEKEQKDASEKDNANEKEKEEPKMVAAESTEASAEKMET